MKARILGAALAVFTTAACAAKTQWASATEVSTPSSRRVEIEMNRHGFEPSEIRVRSNETVTFVFTRMVEDRCMERVLVHLGDRVQIGRDTPMHEPAAVTLRLDSPGELGLTCNGGSHGATIVVETEVKK